MALCIADVIRRIAQKSCTCRFLVTLDEGEAEMKKTTSVHVARRTEVKTESTDVLGKLG